MIVSAHHPQFLPWLGFFDKVQKSDIFILLDTAYFKKNQYLNRNKIKTIRGNQWLTVPVFQKVNQQVKDVEICNQANWRKKHLNTLLTNYSKAACFDEMWPMFEEAYSVKWDNLCDLNLYLIRKVKDKLNITTPVYLASELGDFPTDPDQRFIELVKHFKADVFLASANGRAYMDLAKYEAADITVVFQIFNHPEYAQLYWGFEYNLSVIDLLFNQGDKSATVFETDKNHAYEYVNHAITYA